jgi:hypothetical protein
VVRQALDDVIGMEQRLFDQPAKVGVVGQVENPSALPAGFDQAGETELGQVLGDGRGLSPDMLCEKIYRVLAMEKRPQDPQSSRVGQQLQRVHCHIDLELTRHPSYLRIHADKTNTTNSPVPSRFGG